jgi:hypothetical protein
MFRDLLAPPPVPEGNGHGFFGVFLPHNVFIQLRDGFPGGEMVAGTLEQFDQ